MKRAFALPALILFSLAVLVACNTPQPLPVAPTPIATLPPATLPAAVTSTPPAALVGVTFPTTPPTAANGEKVYQAKCVSCHGADGKAQVAGARDFTDVSYMRDAIPVEFYSVVTKGKDQMPAWNKDLTDQERWDVTYYLWHFAIPNAQLVQGKTVFDANCVSCHGADGSGLIPQAAKLNNIEFMASRPLTQFYQAVSGGKGIMPAWQDRLSSDDRWAAVEYAQSFTYKPLGQ